MPKINRRELDGKTKQETFPSFADSRDIFPGAKTEYFIKKEKKTTQENKRGKERA